MEILARNRSGWSLLEYIDIEESEIDHYGRVTGAYAIVCIKGLYLIGFNNWRRQWEFPAGGIEEGETQEKRLKGNCGRKRIRRFLNFSLKGCVK